MRTVSVSGWASSELQRLKKKLEQFATKLVQRIFNLSQPLSQCVWCVCVCAAHNLWFCFGNATAAVAIFDSRSIFHLWFSMQRKKPWAVHTAHEWISNVKHRRCSSSWHMYALAQFWQYFRSIPSKTACSVHTAHCTTATAHGICLLKFKQQQRENETKKKLKCRQFALNNLLVYKAHYFRFFVVVVFIFSSPLSLVLAFKCIVSACGLVSESDGNAFNLYPLLNELLRVCRKMVKCR